MKNLLKSSLAHIAGTVPLNRLIRLSGQRLFLPFFHAIQGNEALPHIHNLYRPRTEKEFKNELEWLLKHYEPADLETLTDIAKGFRIKKKNRFFLSFDDGLREVYDIAAPILKQKGIPAAIFLNSDFVDNRALFFRYKAGLLIEHLRTHLPLTRDEDYFIRGLLEDSGIMGRSLSQNLLGVRYHQKLVLDKIAAILKVNFDDFLKKQQPYLSTPQIKSLIADGFYVGAHSIDHPRYADLGLEEQIRQTRESIRFVQENFGVSYRIFAFPFTDFKVSRRFFQLLEERNITDLTFGCAGLKKDVTPFHFHRFSTEDSHLPAGRLIKAEYAYFILKRMAGKDRLVRR